MDREKLEDLTEELRAVAGSLDHLFNDLRKQQERLNRLHQASHIEGPLTWMRALDDEKGTGLEDRSGTFREYAQDELPDYVARLDWAVKKADHLTECVMRASREFEEALRAG